MAVAQKFISFAGCCLNIDLGCNCILMYLKEEEGGENSLTTFTLELHYNCGPWVARGVSWKRIIAKPDKSGIVFL
jgi:hypothetical protein